MSKVALKNLTVAESDFLQHVQRWGSDGYPIQKAKSGKWLWVKISGIKGAPTVYKTKAAATAAIGAYIDILLDKHAGRAG